MSQEKVHQVNQCKKKVKVVFLGDRSVGKSSIIKRFIHNQFEQNSQPTIGIDFMAKNIKYKHLNYKIQLWDTAGQQKYRSLVKGYLKGADACIFVYDCTNITTYYHLPEWINMFNSVSQRNAYSIIVGNKSDMEFNLENLQKQQQLFRRQEQLLQNIQELMTSAKLGVNISEIFQHIMQHISIQNGSIKQEKQNGKVSLLSQITKSLNNFPCC